MQKALPKLPVVFRDTPAGITTQQGDLTYAEYADSGSIGLPGSGAPLDDDKPAQETPKGEIF